jgi:hypothetical protein
MQEKLKAMTTSRKGYKLLTSEEYKQLQKEVVTWYNKGNTFESTWKHFCISNTFCRKLIMQSGNKTALKYMNTRKNKAYFFEWVEDTSREFCKLILSDSDMESEMNQILYK